MIVFQYPYGTEGDHTPEIGSIFFRNDLILPDYTEGCFGIPFYGIQLVAGFCAVKIDLLAVVYVTDRDSIRITVVS